MMSKPLVIITGASSGIGEATAKTFSAAGHPLLLLARRVERLEALKLPNSLNLKVDVTNRDQFIAAVEKAEAQFGPADLLVNNAGVMLLGKMQAQEPEEWQAMMDVNVKGVLNGVKAVLNQMIERQGGTIINISSIAGFKTFPNHAAYCATKYAVHGLTESIRGEVAEHNVRVSLVSPGVVETELLGHTTSNEIVTNYNTWKESISGGLQAQHIAEAIQYIYNQPQAVCLREVVIAPTRQSL